MHKGVITTNDSQYDEIIEYESDRKPQRDIIEDEKKTIELYYQRQVKVSKYLLKLASVIYHLLYTI